MLNSAIAIIQDEHRSLAAVVHGLRFLVREMKEKKHPPDFPVLWAMIYFLDAFPEKLHHPKEDLYLFDKLAARTRDADDVIASLKAQHADGASQIRELERALGYLEAGKVDGLESFSAAVEIFAESTWEHMSLEEKVIIPLARRYLTPLDWVEIGHAFGQNGDPRFGAEPDHEFRDLFSRIVNIAPPPIGVGPSESAGGT